MTGGWQRDGYLVIEDFVSTAACSTLRARALELVAERADDGSVGGHSIQDQYRDPDDYFLGSSEDIRLFFEQAAIDDDGELRRPFELAVNKLGHAMHDLDPVFDEFSRGTGLDRVAEEIGLVEPLLLQSMYIFKQPGIGAEFEPHCDHTFLWTEPATVVGFWFAIEDASVHNGCLQVLPGGHRLPPNRRWRLDAAGAGGFESLGTEPYPVDGFVPLEVPAGTLVVLDGGLPHRSDVNESSTSRHAYALHAISAAADYPTDNWLQRPNLPLRGFA